MPSIGMVASTLAAVAFAVIIAFGYPDVVSLSSAHAKVQEVFSYGGSRSQDSWNIFYHLGGNSPWIPKLSNILDESIDAPPGCRVEQVHMLSRHAERYPTVRAGIRMLELYHRLVNMNVTFEKPLEFINTWNFFMPDPAGRLEHLIPVGPYAGTLEAFQTGVKLRTRYEDLIDQARAREQTRLWATDSVRIHDTASYFAAGLYGLHWKDVADLNVVPEATDRGADTLTPGRTCPAYRDNTDRNGKGHDYGYSKLEAWQSIYLPNIAARLASLTPNVTFTHSELYTMQEICGFEMLSKGFSPWCKVFTHEEWLDFEYARDLLHYYRSGPGNPYGPAMGWLFLNVTTNLLLQGPEAGPLFFSFVHDGDIVPFLSALDLLPQSPPLEPDRRMDNRTWRTSDVVPMGGRVILERLACRAQQNCWSNAPYYPNHVYCDPIRDDHFVRINVNDGIVGLPGCQDGPSGSCPLDKFAEHVKKRGKEAGDFGQLCGLPSDAASAITFLKQPEWNGDSAEGRSDRAGP